MKIEITFSEFHDRIQRYDSCSLSYGATRALYDWINERIDDGIISDDICIGDWAILTCEYTLEEIQGEYEDQSQTLNDWDDVADAIAWDGLGNCYADVIVIDSYTAVMVSL